jgi:hypothetical protein
MDFPELKVHINMTNIVKRVWVMALLTWLLGGLSGSGLFALILHLQGKL